MTKEDLVARIAKKEKDIEKINKRIAKWSNGLREKDVEACKPFATEEYQVARNIYREYLSTHNDIPAAEDWNKGPNIDELHRAYIDLGEANGTLEKYRKQLKTIEEDEASEKIPAIWNFLNEWEVKCRNWYLDNAKKFYELEIGYREALENFKKEYIEKHPQPSKDDYRESRDWDRLMYRARENFFNNYYSNINALTRQITTFETESRGEYPNRYSVVVGYYVNEEMLNKVLAEEKIRKYKDLVARVTAVVGTITDATGLTIGNKDGEINGYVIGHEGKCSVETISAGGYNIQCFHYRVLVHKIA